MEYQLLNRGKRAFCQNVRKQAGKTRTTIARSTRQIVLWNGRIVQPTGSTS